jgi:hypothetical protein
MWASNLNTLDQFYFIEVLAETLTSGFGEDRGVPFAGSTNVGTSGSDIMNLIA